MRLATLSATLATVAVLAWMMSFGVRPTDSLFLRSPSAAHASGSPAGGLLSPARHG